MFCVYKMVEITIKDSRSIWGLLAHLGSGYTKFLTPNNYLNTIKITNLQKALLFKALNFNKKTLKLST